MVVFRGIEVYHTTVRSALSRSGLPDIDYALNPYVGCGHGCLYCYARLYTRDKRVYGRWGLVVVVKSNIASVLEREVRRLMRGIVGVGTVTDAYQPVEAVYRLTRRCLEVLLKHGFRVSIQTKNTLIARDLDVLERYRDLVDVGFTITTTRGEVSMLIEPRSSPPSARAEMLRRLSSVGIKTWVFYGPVIPGLNDSERDVEEVARLAHESSSTLYYDPLRVKPFMRDPGHPLHAYAFRKNPSWWSRVEGALLRYCHEYGITCKPGFSGDAHQT